MKSTFFATFSLAAAQISAGIDCTNKHVVVVGDTFYEIANKANITIEALVSINSGIKDINYLDINDEICLQRKNVVSEIGLVNSTLNATTLNATVNSTVNSTANSTVNSTAKTAVNTTKILAASLPMVPYH